MPRVYNPRTRRLEDNGVPVVQPPPGSTIAPDAAPQFNGSYTGGPTSTAGQRLAASPAVFQPQAHAANTLAPTLNSTGARPVAGPPAPAVAPTAAQFAAAPIGKVGTSYGAAPAEGPLAPGSTMTVANGTRTPGSVTVGATPSGGQSGIFVDGKSVTHDATGNLVDAPTTAAPLSPADQRAQILQLYPQVGVAGTPENKQFVDAFNKGGQNQTGVLDLAHTLFAPKTQAGTLAATKVATQADQAKVAAQTNADRQATLAARTPEEVAAATGRATRNQATLDKAGQEVLDANPTSKSIVPAISDVFTSAGNAFDSAASATGSAIKNVFGGFGNPTAPVSSPSSNPPIIMPNPGAADAPNRRTIPLDNSPLANITPALAPTSIANAGVPGAPPVSAPDPLTGLKPAPVVPVAPGILDDDEEDQRKKRLAGNS